MTYAEAIQFLYGLRLFGAKFGLENTRRLAALAGDPQEKLRFIHVAGTNGKGSTCAMLESIYRAAGLRVGLFTSPHLVSFRERIQVNRQLISESEVVRLVTQIQPLLKRFPADHHPTFFEVITVMALKFFAEQGCDLVIWETGLGGRLDATNIVLPLASVITNIAFDHEQWLGDTLEKIAAEKAGIIKPGVPVVTATDAPEALRVIEQTAREQGVVLTRVGPDHASRLTHHASLLGAHQKINAALALATVEILRPIIPVSEEQIRAGLAGCELAWPTSTDHAAWRTNRFAGWRPQCGRRGGAARGAGKGVCRRPPGFHFWRPGGQKMAGDLPPSGTAGGEGFHRARGQRPHGGGRRTGRGISFREPQNHRRRRRKFGGSVNRL